ncbi:MAG: hypothetical protein IPL01_22100 [Acidobacteria bacterium]|nr:hypothetical protein [Acidobacteriota bacterium]
MIFSFSVDLLDRSKVDISVPRNPPPEVALVPTGKYKTPEAMLKDFDKQRDETIQIIENLKSKLARKLYLLFRVESTKFSI